MKRLTLLLALVATICGAAPVWTLYKGSAIVKPRVAYASLDDCVAGAKAQPAGSYSCTTSVPVSIPAVPAVPAWKKIADEGDMATLTAAQIVRFGTGTLFVEKPFPAGMVHCTVATFGSDPLFGTRKECDLKSGPPIVIPPPPPVVDHSGMGPTVDASKIPPQAKPDPGVRVRTTWHAGPYMVDGKEVYRGYFDGDTEPGVWNPACTGWGKDCKSIVYDPLCPADGPWCFQYPNEVPVGPRQDIGGFRNGCSYGWMSRDDSIVYPGQPGRAHLHTGVGRVAADMSKPADFSIVYPSTCAGGAANQSSYWNPALIDTKDGHPLVPNSSNNYYKCLYELSLADCQKTEPMPRGLKMIVGDATNKDPNFGIGGFTCFRPPNGAQSPTRNNFGDLAKDADANGPFCTKGAELRIGISHFPNCWDGVNLDSPDHRSHVVNPVQPLVPPYNIFSCPPTHPHILPGHSQNWNYTLERDGQVANLRFSSDAYDLTLPGGLSYHQDVEFNWQPEFMQQFVTGCLTALKDCHDNLLGDDRTLY